MDDANLIVDITKKHLMNRLQELGIKPDKLNKYSRVFHATYIVKEKNLDEEDARIFKDEIIEKARLIGFEKVNCRSIVLERQENKKLFTSRIEICMTLSNKIS
jgi:hypothetical protein